MKTTSVFLCAFITLTISSAAFAQKKKGGNAGVEQITSIPPEAEPLYTVNVSQLSTSSESTQKEAQEKIREKEKNMDLELNCRAILYKWESSKKLICDARYSRDANCLNPFSRLFDDAEYKTERRIDVQVFCLKRSFDQKMLLSLLRQCEAAPTMECYQMRESFKDIKPVYRINL